MAFGLVNCSVCSIEYIKDNRHINENIKLGNNFYCSKICFSKAKNKQRVLICENAECSKKFKRSLKETSYRNFCSVACAMKIIGPENGLKNKKCRYCKYCGMSVSYRKLYCSNKCWALAHQISKVLLLNEITRLAQELGRAPTRREYDRSRSCIKHFGSWNKALLAAGLTPHRSLNQRMYQRRRCIARDGHQCDSVSELIIDNWLTEHSISHRKGQSYPTSKHTADWTLDRDIYIEYFGLANDSIRYDAEIKRKRQLCNELGIKLIEVYSKDIFPKNNLKDIIGETYSPNQSLISDSASSGTPEA